MKAVDPQSSMNARSIVCVALLLVAACTTTPTGLTMPATNEAEIRQAERALELALSSGDPLAWVEHYTDDAVFVAPGAPAEIAKVVGVDEHPAAPEGDCRFLGEPPSERGTAWSRTVRENHHGAGSRRQ